MADDLATNQVILFGGYDGVTHYNDTWNWDGASWNLLAPTHSPSPRRSFGMVYDEATAEIVLFGGFDGVNDLDDTWTWDGTDWTEQYPSMSPPPSAVFGMAYDRGTQMAVLFGGDGGTESPGRGTGSIGLLTIRRGHRTGVNWRGCPRTAGTW